MSASTPPEPISMRCCAPTARIALFVVYAWFGILKVIGLSPATELVRALHESTIGFVDFDLFFPSFGAFEVLVGLLFLFTAATRAALTLVAIHLVTTILPLFVLPSVAWQQFLVPTLEGQYIIKNLLIVAAAVTVAGEHHRAGVRRRSALNVVEPGPSEREIAPVAEALASDRATIPS